ncbi:hypothetical protein CTAYLR_008150 [Chrysophaeum taylorii]|uniref:YHYH domain-containing protein n=1 Tax=Chrysophaeum taylorii TaxID=2483200 RepID=A0AAD7XRX1_9STRA|nr:hypothetical protein CTAYLR_008150 [Chrysophaeum taylorii]
MSRDFDSCRGNEEAEAALSVVCEDVDDVVKENWYCMRDDSFLVRREATMFYYTTGCPDHEILADTSGLRSPRYQRYRWRVPRVPRVMGVITYLDPKEPIGVAVNGVPFFTANSTTLEPDACGGIVDDFHRYGYAAMPSCLLRLMGNSTPSPLVGFARDGFPIFGPYDASGWLFSNATLDDCNFAGDRYHVIPTPPYVPQCLVGEHLGYYESAVTSRSCALDGLPTAYCRRTACALDPPNAIDVCAKDRDREPLVPLWALVGLFVALAIFSIYKGRDTVYFLFHCRAMPPPPGPRRKLPPSAVAATSVMGSVILVAFQEEFTKLFYKRNANKIETYANDAVANFLAVAGVLYALVVAQVLGTAYERRGSIQACLSDELAGIHSLVMLVASLDAVTPEAKAKKTEAFDMLHAYVVGVVGELSRGRTEPHDIAVLWCFAPLLQEACRLCHPIHLSQEDIGARALDAASDVARQRYARSSHERKGLGVIFYALNLFLCNAMFFGILLIYSGSIALNLTFCSISVLSIGAMSYMIACLDEPYSGILSLDLADVDVLLETIAECKRSSTPYMQETAIKAKQTVSTIVHATRGDGDDENQSAMEEEDRIRVDPPNADAEAPPDAVRPPLTPALSYHDTLRNRLSTRKTCVQAWHQVHSNAAAPAAARDVETTTTRRTRRDNTTANAYCSWIY